MLRNLLSKGSESTTKRMCTSFITWKDNSGFLTHGSVLKSGKCSANIIERLYMIFLFLIYFLYNTSHMIVFFLCTLVFCCCYI